MAKQKGKYDIDWRGIVERAVMLRNLKNKAPTYLSHLANPSTVKDQEKSSPLKEEKTKTQDARQTHMNEIDSINNARKIQKDFVRADAASRELIQIALSFLGYLKLMKRCGFVYESQRTGRFDWKQKFVYNGTKNGKPIHELI